MKNDKNVNRQWIWPTLVFALFLFIRLFRFADTFHFYYDQPLFSLKALEIWRTHKIPLIGPPISFTVEGRNIFQGGIIYLVQLFFLVLGGFDPYRSTLIFVIASACMICPLWYAISNWAGQKAALLVTVLYALLPSFVRGTLELTNPYYQLALTPFLILALYGDHKKRTPFTLLAVGMVAGFLLQFHYQFVLAIAGLGVYYVWSRVPIKQWLVLIAGMTIGFSPLIIFELRNNFYNLRTLLFFVDHWGTVGVQLTHSLPFQYFLSPLLLLITALAIRLAHYISWQTVAIIALPLFVWSVDIYVVHPHQGGILTDWSYADEKKVAGIIAAQHLDNFNIAAWYDTKAITQKYFLSVANVNGDFENYRTEKYLFVIYPSADFVHDGAYELNTFTPSTIVQSWPISSKYSLYLAKRD